MSKLLSELNQFPPRFLVVGYLAAQALAVAGWWCVIWVWPESIAWFHPMTWPAESFMAFAVSDCVMLVLGSGAVAWVVATGRSFASLSLWALAAAAWYPTLYCLGVSCLTNEAWVATAMMTAMAGSTLAMATIQGTPLQAPATYRATRLDSNSAVAWTMLQVIIFWGTFLVILPLGIHEAEQKLDWPSFYFAGQTFAGITVLVLASGLGLASGMTMATQGKGTPLPTASAAELVSSGPYRWIRNPMALAGIVQGLGVGLLMGSYGVIVYALAGAVLWHVLVRPSEEHDLQIRFGSAYKDYRRRVGLWLPGCWKSHD